VAEAVDPIVHILTELLVNALQFSTPEQYVTVSSARVGDMLYLSVDDHGIGLPDVALTDIKRNLAQFDLASAARHMGIPVIGQLAAPLGVQLTFRPRQPRGTSVEIVIPAQLLIDKPHGDVPIIRGLPEPHLSYPGRSGADSRPHQAALLARQPAPAPAAPMLAARAALGEDTELLPIAGRPAPGTGNSPPLVVFASVLHDNPYFSVHQVDGAGPKVPESWQAGQQAAEAVQRATTALATVQASPDSTTPNGLPMRRPGEFFIPAPATTAPAIPAQRDRAATRRGMAALTRTAARRTRPESPRQIG
jgi:hypothetical protein